MTKSQLFNPEHSDDLSLRRVVGGETTRINNFNEIKYKWTTESYNTQRDQFWIPEIISLLGDKDCYENRLSKEKRKAFNETLSFLTFLDSIHSLAVPNFSHLITAPEITRLFTIQAYFEVIHSQAYSYIIESLCDPNEISSIYYMFRTDETLLNRCQQITNQYNEYLNDKENIEAFKDILIFVLLLEGFLFYNGFNYFYFLAFNGEMLNTKSEIRLIERDELSHLDFYTQLINTMSSEGHVFNKDRISKIASSVFDLEVYWATKTYQNIPGMTKESILQFCNYRMNKIFSNIGFPDLYPKVDNPYYYLESIAAGSGTNIKTNVFESRNTNYKMSTTMTDWEKI